MATVGLAIPEQEIADFCRRNRIRSLALFGSALRADFRPDSGVDLLVEYEPDARVGLLALARMHRELSDLIGRPVDLVPRDGLNSAIRDAVLADAQAIYAIRSSYMETPIAVRRARGEDARGLADLIINLHHFSRLEGKPPDEVRSSVRRELELCLADSSHSVYVAEDSDGRMIGYAAVHWLPYLFLPGPEGYVSELFVVGEARGQRVGTRLLGAVKEEAIQRGCSRLSVLNMRDRESYQRHFYEKGGWQERADAVNFVYDWREQSNR